MDDYIINASTIRECNFAMGTIILGKGFAQALVHTVHSKTLSQNCPHGKIRYFLTPNKVLRILKNMDSLLWKSGKKLWTFEFSSPFAAEKNQAPLKKV